MKITADFTCLLKKEEQKIKEGNYHWNSSRQLTDLLFQLEEKDYDQAIDICREYKKESILKELKSAREEYLNTDYDNLQERVLFLQSFQLRCLNPLVMPEYLVGEIEYRKSWENKKRVRKFINDIYHSNYEYQALLIVQEQVLDLCSYWVGRENYLNKQEGMDNTFNHLCNIPSNFPCTPAATSAAWYKEGRQ